MTSSFGATLVSLPGSPRAGIAQLLLNRLASAIADGSADVAVLCGGESGRTRRASRRRGERPQWTIQDDDVEPDWSDETPFVMSHPAEVARGIIMPTQAYPLFENALWHESGRTLELQDAQGFAEESRSRW